MFPCYPIVFLNTEETKNISTRKRRNFMRKVNGMVNTLFTGRDNMSMHDRDCEWLRNKAYTRCVEKADFTKVDKIVDGIKSFKINKSNLVEEVSKMTKRVRSDHSIKRWQILTEWFLETDWH